MNWQDIKVSEDSTHFIYEGRHIFEKTFKEVLKFHAPGLAAVKDETGAYHIDRWGNPLYSERYSRTFGYYCNRASVVDHKYFFHINEKGKKAYSNAFAWTGNFQEDLCTVRDKNNHYFYIDLNGKRIYSENFMYAGDFKDGIACVKAIDGFYIHIDTQGNCLNNKKFLDLGIFHKNIATAKDVGGWHHINKDGSEIYRQRYLAIEPYYNGLALVTQFDDRKLIIDETGKTIIIL